MPLINVSRKKAPIIMGIAIVVILISLISIFKTGSSSKAKIDVGRFEGLGRITGEETANFLGSGKSIVLVRQSREMKSEVLEKMHAAFTKALKDGGVSVTAEEEIQMGEEAPEYMMIDMIGLPIGEYVRVAEAHSSVDAIISMVGGLFAGPAELDQIPDGLPPLIVAHGADHRMSSVDLFERGVLMMVVTPRHDLPDTESEPETPREWFDTYFEIITADSVEDAQY